MRHLPLFLMFQTSISFSAHLSFLSRCLQQRMRQGFRMASQVPFQQTNSFIFESKCSLVKASSSLNSRTVILIVAHRKLLLSISYSSGASGYQAISCSIQLSLAQILLRVQTQYNPREAIITLPPTMVAVDIPHRLSVVDNPRMLQVSTGTPKILPIGCSMISFGALTASATTYPLAMPFASRPPVTIPTTPVTLVRLLPIMILFSNRHQ